MERIEFKDRLGRVVGVAYTNKPLVEEAPFHDWEPISNRCRRCAMTEIGYWENPRVCVPDRSEILEVDAYDS